MNLDSVMDLFKTIVRDQEKLILLQAYAQNDESVIEVVISKLKIDGNPGPLPKGS